MKFTYGLIGAGGFGREVMPLCRTQLHDVLRHGETQLVFVVEDEFIPAIGMQSVNGIPVMGMDKFLCLPGSTFFNIAIADVRTRIRIASKCLAAGALAFDIYAESSIRMDDVEIGVGAIFCPHAIASSNIRIGKFFHANLFSYVAHDCEIGNFVTFAPKVACLGNVRIEDNVFVGAGALIKQGSKQHPLVIGEGATIGMGAVVTKSVAPNTIVVGNPARLMAR